MNLVYFNQTRDNSEQSMDMSRYARCASALSGMISKLKVCTSFNPCRSIFSYLNLGKSIPGERRFKVNYFDILEKIALTTPDRYHASTGSPIYGKLMCPSMNQTV
jgi:hypothetical protein